MNGWKSVQTGTFFILTTNLTEFFKWIKVKPPRWCKHGWVDRTDQFLTDSCLVGSALFLHLFSIILGGIWQNYWNSVSLFCFKNIVYDIFTMDFRFLRADPVCLVCLQEIKMQLSGGNHECIEFAPPPQTDLTSMKMTKNASRFHFYLFLFFHLRSQ